ncbi:MAG TPA: Gfo/Idh/MocA family oxidoreductase [Candidatus Marinimicrobia bacterium]|nr:Gfo/Idh/MocA family oxidoreductase [Candidatus Neomarinimicrobiota bacterium]
MNRQKKSRVGIFGIGQFGIHHLKNWLALDDVELVGFCDIDPLKQSLIPKEYGVPFYNQSELIQKADIIDVVTPTSAHFEIAAEALEAGHSVFVEKPFTETLAQAEKLIELGKKYGAKIAVGLIERFNPVITALHEILTLRPAFIESHRMGPFNPYRGTDVPVMMELMIHDIDLILHMVPYPLAEIRASGTKVLSNEIDIVNARIEFANGAVANVSSSRVTPSKMRKMRLFQENQYVSIDFIEQKADVYTIDSAEISDETDNRRIMVNIPDGFNKSIHYQQIKPESYNAMQREFRSFIKALECDKEPIVSGEDGLRALSLAIQIEEQISKIAGQ